MDFVDLPVDSTPTVPRGYRLSASVDVDPFPFARDTIDTIYVCEIISRKQEIILCILIPCNAKHTWNSLLYLGRNIGDQALKHYNRQSFKLLTASYMATAMMFDPGECLI